MPANDDGGERSAEAWASDLKSNWRRLARTPSRDYFVASHRDWDRPETWTRQAEVDTESLLYDLDTAWLARAHVLEVGCGVGRLVPHLLPQVASYSGCDIAPEMLDEARQRHAANADRVRFGETDGLSVPEALRDRQYDLAFAWAVFIHCPRDVIIPLATDACSLVSPGGHFRFQLRGDANDPTGIEAPPDISPAPEPTSGAEDMTHPDDLQLVEDECYLGHAFGLEEARTCFGALGGTLRLFRFDPDHIYGDIGV